MIVLFKIAVRNFHVQLRPSGYMRSRRRHVGDFKIQYIIPGTVTGSSYWYGTITQVSRSVLARVL